VERVVPNALGPGLASPLGQDDPPYIYVLSTGSLRRALLIEFESGCNGCEATARLSNNEPMFPEKKCFLLETRLAPPVACCYHRSLTFYLGNPSSIPAFLGS